MRKLRGGRLGPNSRNCDYLSRNGLSKLSKGLIDIMCPQPNGASETASLSYVSHRLQGRSDFAVLEDYAGYEGPFIKSNPKFDRSQNWCTIYSCSGKNNTSILVYPQLYLEAHPSHENQNDLRWT